MRIIAGEFRSRKLFTPEGDVTRPIPDRVKESIFQILRGHCEGATVFDGFAGCGAIGLEALSRGASSCVFVERDKFVAQCLKQNIELLQLHDRAEIVEGDALGAGALARAPRPLKLAFLDPPYPLAQDPASFRRVMAQLAALVDLLQDDGYAILRTPSPLLHAAATPQQEIAVAAAKERRNKKPRERDVWKHERERWQQSKEHKGDDMGKHGKGGLPKAVFAGTPGLSHDAEGAPAEDTETDIEFDVQEWEGEDSAAQADAAALLAKPAEVFKPEVTSPSLTLKNAIGPETHEYGGMAVHLYMKARTP